MRENEMRDFIELFWDENEPIYSYWDERTDDKKLLCASHDEAVVLRYVLTSPLSTLFQKQTALYTLEQLEAERRQTDTPTTEPDGKDVQKRGKTRKK